MLDSELEKMAAEAATFFSPEQAIERVMQFIPSTERYLRRRTSHEDTNESFNSQHAGDVLAIALVTWNYSQTRAGITPPPTSDTDH